MAARYLAQAKHIFPIGKLRLLRSAGVEVVGYKPCPPAQRAMVWAWEAKCWQVQRDGCMEWVDAAWLQEIWEGAK